jgi:mycothiol synthase
MTQVPSDSPEPPEYPEPYKPGDRPSGSQSAWRALRPVDLPALTELARRCVTTDGGQPFAADPAFLSGCYLTSGRAIGFFDGPRLLSASALRFNQPRLAGPSTVTCGMVDPAWRRRGIGGQGLDWALGQAGRAVVLAESEALSDGAHSLYLSRNMTQILAEHVLQLPAGAPVPPVTAPAGMRFLEWGDADPSRFFAVYAAAFAERPGFPGWPTAQWISWISDDEDFRSKWTLLASLAHAGGAPVDVGFIAGEATGWIAQVGVIPQARGRAVGASLIAEVVRRMRSPGETTPAGQRAHGGVWDGTVSLNVAVDNTRADTLYQRLGFARIGGRARYRLAAP